MDPDSRSPRRGRIVRFTLGALALLGASQLVGCGESGPPEKATPPVVLVLIDTLRADHLGIYGYDRNTSPHLDALGEEGLVFERAFAQSTWTKPTTASILTGVYPSAHGVMQVFSTLSESLLTMAELLKSHDYATAGFVANGFVANKNYGFQQGFDVFEGDDLETEGFAYVRADKMVDRALEWLHTQRATSPDTPPFLYLHVVDPHQPYDPPGAWRERFDQGYEGEVSGFFGTEGKAPSAADLSPADMQHLLDLYDGEIAFADAQLKRLFDGLRELKLYEDALIFVVADHGEEFGEHGSMQHGPRMYQEVVHVPLLVKPPKGDRFPRAQRHDGVAMQVDLVPTVYDALGEVAPAELPGQSLFARAKGQLGASAEIAFGEVDQQNVFRVMVVESHLKHVRQISPEPKQLFFDLVEDPAERVNLSETQADLMLRLSRRLDEYAAAASRRAGFALRIANDSDRMIEVHVRVGAESGQMASFQPLGLELRRETHEDFDEPLDQVEETWGETELNVTRVILRTAPGDLDGFVFAPPEGDDRVFVDIRIDGELVPPEHILLGQSERPEGPQPLMLERSRQELIAADPTRNAAPNPGGYRVFLWRKPDLQANERELSSEDIEELRKLGYFGTED